LSSEWTVRMIGTDDKEWNKIVELLPGKNIYITQEYNKLFEKHFCDEALLFVFGNESDFVVHPVWKRSIDLPFAKLPEKYFDVMSPWYHAGPTMKLEDSSFQEKLGKEFLTAFHDYCVKNKIVSEFIRFYPVINNHTPFSDILNMKKIGDVVIVNLDRTVDEIFRSFSKVCRKNIRRATKSGIEVFNSNKTEDIQKFFEIYSKSMERKKAIEFYKFSYEFLKDLFELLKDNATMFFATYKDNIIVGDIVLHKYGIAEDYLRGFDPSFSNMRPNNMLVYVIVQWCKEQGNKLFNLGGGQSTGDELFRFKSGFSKTTAEYYVSGIVHNQEIYDSLCKKWETHVKTIENKEYFPLYRCETEID